MRLAAIITCAVLTVFFAGVPASAEKRVALVIGNDRYTNLPAEQQLQKAVNDSRVIGEALKKLDFDVLWAENVGRQALDDKFDEFVRKISPGDTAFFFFSGHGVSIGGGNYILPSDVPNVASGQEMRLVRASLGESEIISYLQGRGARVAVVVLDACRNNPFKRPGTRAVGAERGLMKAEPVRGVFSLYSAGIGQTALDRLGDNDANPNSVFTRVFAPALTKPGLDLGTLAVEVREEVARIANTIGHDQRPAYYDETMGGRVYLAGLQPSDPPKPPAPAPQVAPSGSTGPGEAERAWALAKDTTSQQA